MSRFIVPLRVLNMIGNTQLPSPGNGMVNLYFRNSILKQYYNTEKDIVLDRVLEGFTTLSTYNTLLPSDTV